MLSPSHQNSAPAALRLERLPERAMNVVSICARSRNRRRRAWRGSRRSRRRRWRRRGSCGPARGWACEPAGSRTCGSTRRGACRTAGGWARGSCGSAGGGWGLRGSARIRAWGHVGQPGAGHAGHAGQPGAGGGYAGQSESAHGGHVGQPGAGHAGHAGQHGPSVSTKGLLIAAGAFGAVVVAVAAFFILRPDTPQQTAAQESPTTITSPLPGAIPGAAAPEGPGFRGTYNWRNSSGQAGTVTVTSDCPTCDATATSEGRTGIYHWTGTGWTYTADCRTETVTPTVVVNGIVQEASTQASGCPGAGSNTGTLTRVGD